VTASHLRRSESSVTPSSDLVNLYFGTAGAMNEKSKDDAAIFYLQSMSEGLSK
jgi:hypothetical protein